MEMRKLVTMRIITLLLVPFFAFAQSHNDAKGLLNKVYETTVALSSQHITFVNSIEAPSNGTTKTRSSDGELFSIGEMVRIKTAAFEFLSDGKNAYLIYPDDLEIEKAASAEETSLSPADILKNYQSGYSYTMDKKAQVGGRTIQYIRLKPNASEEIREILIGVDMSTHLLYNYTQFGLNGINNTFEVKSYEVNVPLKKSMFDINSAEFEEYEPL